MGLPLSVALVALVTLFRCVVTWASLCSLIELCVCCPSRSNLLHRWEDPVCTSNAYSCIRKSFHPVHNAWRWSILSSWKRRGGLHRNQHSFPLASNWTTEETHSQAVTWLRWAKWRGRGKEMYVGNIKTIWRTTHYIKVMSGSRFSDTSFLHGSHTRLVLYVGHE